MNEETVCGCGRPARYMVSGGKMSCNKYARCASYEELQSTLVDARVKLFSLIRSIIQDFDPYTCNKDITELIKDAKKIIERDRAAYTLYLNKGE